MKIGAMFMMTRCCRICSKLLCNNRNNIENCQDCISYVLREMQRIDKKIKEDYNDRVQSSEENRSRSL